MTSSSVLRGAYSTAESGYCNGAMLAIIHELSHIRLRVRTSLMRCYECPLCLTMSFAGPLNATSMCHLLYHSNGLRYRTKRNWRTHSLPSRRRCCAPQNFAFYLQYLSNCRLFPVQPCAQYKAQVSSPASKTCHVACTLYEAQDALNGA